MLQTARVRKNQWVAFLSNRRAELDEKALLITFLVLVAMIGLTPLGQAVSDQFRNLAGLV